MHGILERLLGEDVELRVVTPPSLGYVRADPSQVEQVILNLAVNARDAMPDGGRLLIETREVMLDAAYAATHPALEPGPHVMLAVSDTGTGMDEPTRQRIFEPFFTTKEVGRGTGLGLSTVYGIVKQSGGSVWVYSEPGHGSTFKVYFPRVEGRPTVVASGAPRGEDRGTETILLVEDQPALRLLAKRVLEAAGYTVVDSANGQEAIAKSDAFDGPIHLLLTDVVMPGMNGRVVAAEITARRAHTRVLFTSGYTDDAILRHGVLDDASRFISKPYTPTELRRKVRQAIDGG
jgi:two-component system, cell cycle sensor histidine kinase and response regulator CckA